MFSTLVAAPSLEETGRLGVSESSNSGSLRWRSSSPYGLGSEAVEWY